MRPHKLRISPRGITLDGNPTHRRFVGEWETA